MVAGTLPVLVTVMVCGALVVFTFWLPNAKLVGLTLTCPTCPVPLRLTLTFTFPLIVRVPVLTPAAVGTNVTARMQLAPGARGERQEPLSWKSPVVEIAVMVIGKSPLLLYVTCCVEPVCRGCAPKVSDVGDTVPCNSWP